MIWFEDMVAGEVYVVQPWGRAVFLGSQACDDGWRMTWLWLDDDDGVTSGVVSRSGEMIHVDHCAAL